MPRFHVFWAVAIVLLAYLATSLLGSRTSARFERVKELRSQIAADTTKINMLDKELAVLAAPERLKKIVDDTGLALQAPTADQILVAENDLALPAGAAAPQLPHAMLAAAPVQPNAGPTIMAWTPENADARYPLAPAQAPFSSTQPEAAAPSGILLASTSARPPRGRLVAFTESSPAPPEIINVPAAAVATPDAPAFQPAEKEFSSLPPRVTKDAGAASKSKYKKLVAPALSVGPTMAHPAKTKGAKIKEIEKIGAPKIAPIKIKKINVASPKAAPRIDVVRPAAEVATPPAKSRPGLSSALIDQIKQDAAREQQR